MEAMTDKRIARVFARRTKATPVDDLVFYDEPGLFAPEVDVVYVSVTFTYDLERGEYLVRAWGRIAPVEIGGPATGMRGGVFVPGLFLKPGYVITSRGCDNRCPHCFVWRREGGVRELPVVDGWNVLDDNLLACSEGHILAVFDMLSRQKHPVEFTGGLEAAKLERWHVEWLSRLKPKQMFFAYDSAEDYEPLVMASRCLSEAGLVKRASHAARCYVLIGHPGDSFEAAELRCRQAMGLGFMPMAMLYRDEAGLVDLNWRRFQREWANDIIVGRKMSVER